MDLGRKGWLGVAHEATAGVPVTPADYIFYQECSLNGISEPIGDAQAYGLRDQEFGNSISGQRRGGGGLKIFADPINAGRLLGYALGTFGSPSDMSNGVYKHTMSRNNSVVPKTASLSFDRSIDRELYTYATVNTLELSFSDGLVEMNTNWMSRFPVTTASGTLTTVSGILFAWKDAKLRLGSSIANADAQTPIDVNNFNVTINNNSVMHYRSGSQDVSFISQGNFTVEGSFTLFLDSTTRKTDYYNLVKQTMTLMIRSGRDIGGGLYDEIKLEFPRIRIQEHPVETGVDELFVETVNFVAEYDSGTSMTMDAIIQNRKAAYA